MLGMMVGMGIVIVTIVDARDDGRGCDRWMTVGMVIVVGRWG